MTREQEKAITWFQINNIVPIIATAIMIAGSFFLVQTKVALMEQKLDYIIDTQKNTANQSLTQQSQTSVNTIDIRELRTRLTILEGAK